MILKKPFKNFNFNLQIIMSVEELQKRIEKLEKENIELKDGWIYRYTKDDFECDLEDYDRQLTDEEYKELINKLNNTDYLHETIRSAITEIVYDWNDENPDKTKIFQVRRYIAIEFYEDDPECELVEKKDFKTEGEARKYYNTIENYGKNLSWYDINEGDADYYEIKENFQTVVLQFNKISVKDLKCLCKLHDIKGYSKMKKQQLLDVLREHEYFKNRFEEEIQEEEENKEENYEEIYKKLQNEWINVWKEDNAYLVEETNNGTFSQLIHQTPFEVHCGGYPDYVTGGDGFWAPTLQEFIDYMDKEEWVCADCNEEYDCDMRKCRVGDKIVCEDCE